ncbi:MAG: ABC transporter permease [Lachnospiraceae bacterium]|jgi:putative ABC transport system permease protein|nr:ABC transporter permease [Lachnospiraceae bacterium]
MLKKKVFRDIKFNKSQFVTIFLMVFLGVFIYSGISSYMDGMKNGAQKYYDENNLQDVWVVGSNFTKEDLEQIRELDNVNAAERKLTVMGSIDNIKDSTAQINFIESNDISKFHVIDGIKFDKNEQGVWIDSYWAENNNLKVGDTLTIRYNEKTFDQKIVGIILSPDHVYDPKSEAELFPTHMDYGFIYLSVNEFVFGAENAIYNYILVDIDNVKNIDETKLNIENVLENAVAITDRTHDLSVKRFEDEIEEGNTYTGVFSGIFLFIAMLSVVTTMNRLVRKQRGEIGILKALGFRNKKIALLYVSYGFWISLCAGILGVILGPIIVGQIFLNMILTYYEMPELLVVVTWKTWLVSALIIGVVSIVTYLSCRNELKEKAIYLLKIEEPKTGKTNVSLDKGIFKKFGFSTKWNIRDIMRSRIRTIMGVIGVTSCCALIICAFGILNTLNDYIDWQLKDLYNFEYRIALEEGYTDKSFNDIVSSYGNNTSQTLNIEFKKEDKKEINTITVDDANGLLRYTDENRNFLELENNGIYVTRKLAETSDLKVGDTVTWHILGSDTWYSSQIIGFNTNPQNQNITMTKKYLDSMGIEYNPDKVYTNTDLSNIKELSGTEAIQNRESIIDGVESMLETMKTMVIMIIFAAIILGIVIVYNLGILSFVEKTYQFATLKVLGFQTKKIGKIFIKQNIWITFIAVLLGAPLGYYMAYFIFRMAMADDIDMMAKVNVSSYLYGIVGTIVVSFIVNYILSRKIKTINMVESLKANE